MPTSFIQAEGIAMEISPKDRRPVRTADEKFMQWQEKDLEERLPAVMEERKYTGLDGLVGGLEAVIINTEPERLGHAVEEILACTGLSVREHFSDHISHTCVLGTGDSPDLIFSARVSGVNPFLPFNRAEKTQPLPNTRLETFIFRVRDIERYTDIQRGRGVRFMPETVQEHPGYRFIQTYPSKYTGNSIGFIEWNGSAHSYRTRGSRTIQPPPKKPDYPWLSLIHGLDHAATRVRAAERNNAILEFLSLTGYHFDFAVFVISQNSITSVARLGRDDFAMVFTSGIEPFTGTGTSGPTEMFIHHYGTRVHHCAFRTEEIDSVIGELRAHGMEFLVDLVGSPQEGLEQTFSRPSPHTMIVNEYIHRYEGFDGFFTRSNVEALTRATGRQ